MGQASRKFYFLKPDGTKENVDAEFDSTGADGKLKYTTIAGDIDTNRTLAGARLTLKSGRQSITPRRPTFIVQSNLGMSGTLLVVLSDSHCGSSTAVSPLKYTVHNRSTYETQVMEANRLQKWLYRNWMDFWDYVKDKSKKKRVIVAHLGDVIDFNHHGSTQLVQEVGDQVKMALELLEPYRDIADKFIGILGTAAHAGTDHAVESDLYRQLGSRLY